MHLFKHNNVHCPFVHSGPTLLLLYDVFAIIKSVFKQLFQRERIAMLSAKRMIYNCESALYKYSSLFIIITNHCFFNVLLHDRISKAWFGTCSSTWHNIFELSWVYFRIPRVSTLSRKKNVLYQLAYKFQWRFKIKPKFCSKKPKGVLNIIFWWKKKEINIRLTTRQLLVCNSFSPGFLWHLENTCRRVLVLREIPPCWSCSEVSILRRNALKEIQFD